MYKQFKVTNKPGYGCMKAPKTMKIWRTVPEPWQSFVIELKDMPDHAACREARIYFGGSERDDLYSRLNWGMLMNKEEIEFQQHQWNHVAVRALLMCLAATHHKDFSEFTLDLQNDRWWHDSAPLDAEPLPPYEPKLTDAPRRRRSPKRNASSSTSSAPSDANGSRECGELRPRVLFRTSRLSQEPMSSTRRGSIRWGSKSHPHQVADGDYLCDGVAHAHITTSRSALTWGWEITDVKNDECPYRHAREEPEHTLEDDNGLPLDPLWPISPMSPVMVEPPTPIYVEE